MIFKSKIICSPLAKLVAKFPLRGMKCGCRLSSTLSHACGSARLFSLILMPRWLSLNVITQTGRFPQTTSGSHVQARSTHRVVYRVKGIYARPMDSVIIHQTASFTVALAQIVLGMTHLALQVYVSQVLYPPCEFCQLIKI